LGQELQRQLDKGEDSFVAAMQSELLSLRSTARTGADKKGMDKDWKEHRQMIFADLLHLGTVHRLSSEGITLSSLGQQELILSDALRVLPSAAAVEARDYVLVALPAEVTDLKVTRSNLAPLLMGAALYGYFLAGAMQSQNAREVAKLAESDWESPAAFTVVSAHVGRLLNLPEESNDPLRRYASLTSVATAVQAVHGTGPGAISDIEGGLLHLNAEWLRGLLGELCAFAFILRLWEQKIVKFIFPE